MRGSTLRLLLATGLCLAGCKRVSERTLTDTEGRSFRASCDREGHCALKREAAEPVSADKSELAVHVTGRLVTICDVVPNKKPQDVTDCRALLCTQDSECPPSHGLRDGACVSGLCTEPSNAVGRDDAIMLCLAGTGLGNGGPAQVDRYAMALNCGNPCLIPKPCRQL